MSVGFLAPAMLLGLAAIAIPVIVHLLSKRRYDVVDWGAMQFLELGKRMRRRVRLQDLLLMAVRMGLLGLLVGPLAISYFFELVQMYREEYLGAPPRGLVSPDGVPVPTPPSP